MNRDAIMMIMNKDVMMVVMVIMMMGICSRRGIIHYHLPLAFSLYVCNVGRW